MTRKLCTFKILDWRYFCRTLCAQQNVFSQKYQTFSFSAFFVFVSKFLNFFLTNFSKKVRKLTKTTRLKNFVRGPFCRPYCALYNHVYNHASSFANIVNFLQVFEKKQILTCLCFFKNFFKKLKLFFLIILSFHFVHKTHWISFTKSKQIDQRNWLNKWIFIKHNFWLFP